MLEDEQILQNNSQGASLPSSPEPERKVVAPSPDPEKMDEGRPENLDTPNSARHDFEEEENSEDGVADIPEISSDADTGFGRSSRLKSDIIPILDISDDDKVDWSSGKGKKGKKSRKKATSTEDVMKGLEALSIEVFTCNVCAVVYASRTKLFEHVRDSGHALAGESDKASVGGKKSKSKGKRK
jgi:hypothetical protein